ncbi:DUF305 domain-containing protein [Candidatus Nomurabacteria bacterium]|nr:DUF305 domain-containing protein [Candidatus Nomurabacteria bacterium]
MKKEILFGITGVVFGVILMSLFSSGAPFRSMMSGRNSFDKLDSVEYKDSLNSVNNKTTNRTFGMMSNIDQHFIEQMIPHHDGAIEMSELALTKATHPEIKTLAKSIIESQSKEIKDMQSWYKAWFGQDVKEQNTSGMMGGGGMHMGGTEDMNALKNASDFDKAFIEGMIPHHQLAIMMAQMLKSGTNRLEMLTLANNIIESQSKEITQMQAWYTSWYK